MQVLFQYAGLLAMAGWLLLAVSLFRPRWRNPLWTVTGIAIPAAFAILYAWLMATHWGVTGGGFGSLEEVRTLFTSDALLLGGWVHYLAFDLFVGTWIAREGVRSGIPGLLLIPCLALTFLFGPAGLLLFLLLRLVYRGKTA
jgi:hypothetical protein